MKGFLSKRIAFKIDVTGPENRLFVGASMPASFSPEILQASGSEGVKMESDVSHFNVPFTNY